MTNLPGTDEAKGCSVMDRIETVWDALGNLTYAEMLEVASALRDTYDPDTFDTTDAYDWAALINSAREAAQTADAA